MEATSISKASLRMALQGHDSFLPGISDDMSVIHFDDHEAWRKIVKVYEYTEHGVKGGLKTPLIHLGWRTFGSFVYI